MTDYLDKKASRLPRRLLEDALRAVPAVGPALLALPLGRAATATTAFRRTEALALLAAVLRPSNVRGMALDQLPPVVCMGASVWHASCLSVAMARCCAHSVWQYVQEMVQMLGLYSDASVICAAQCKWAGAVCSRQTQCHWRQLCEMPGPSCQLRRSRHSETPASRRGTRRR